MDTNKLLLKEEVFQIVGCAMEVLNEIGHGLNEKIYENSLTVEFKLRNIAFNQQCRYEVLYKGQHVGEFIPVHSWLKDFHERNPQSLRTAVGRIEMVSVLA